jgi:hypothetical protein
LPDYGGIRQRNVGRASQCIGGFFGSDLEATRRAVQGESSAVEFAEKTIEYAKAKMAYIMALREAVPELENIATGREARPPEVDWFAGAFSLTGEKQEHSADEETAFLLERFSGNPDVEKARIEFEHAQKVEELFHKDFDGLDFTSNSLPDQAAAELSIRVVLE